MSMIRSQHSTPSEYTKQSRDFQLLCRLYDMVYNGLQYDISTIPSILDTSICRDTVLPLLQTKLGFFTNKETDSVSLRYFLDVFPLLVKNKGTAKAIQQAVITFLKINNIDSPVTIYYTVEEMVLANNYTIPDHTVLIGVNSSFLDSTLLEEVFKYILPAGIGYFFYFYSDITNLDKEILENKAVVLYTSHNINAQIRGNDPSYSKDENNRLINAVDTVLLANGDSLIPSVNGTFDAGDTSLFIGQYEGEDTFNNFISSLSIVPIEGNIILYNDKEYLYDGSNWQLISFFGNVTAKSARINPDNYEIIYSIEDEKYYIWDGTTWQENTLAIYVFMNFTIEELGE